MNSLPMSCALLVLLGTVQTSTELQQKFDDLEALALGILKCPKDINIPVEYLNLSFLIKKLSGGYHLVTVFADVGCYSKPLPSLLPDVDSTLHVIAHWNHIATDLTSAFFFFFVFYLFFSFTV